MTAHQIYIDMMDEMNREKLRIADAEATHQTNMLGIEASTRRRAMDNFNRAIAAEARVKELEAAGAGSTAVASLQDDNLILRQAASSLARETNEVYKFIVNLGERWGQGAAPSKEEVEMEVQKALATPPTRFGKMIADITADRAIERARKDFERNNIAPQNTPALQEPE